jgi:periplasmic protein TonB
VKTIVLIFIRYLVAAFFGLIAIGGMFYVLQHLIAEEGTDLKLVTAAKIDFSRLKRDSEVKTTREQKATMKAASATPAPKLSVSSTTSTSTGSLAVVGPVQVQTQEALGGIEKIKLEKVSGGGGSDRDVVPLIRIEPQYPMAAAQQRIEGWCLVRFNISTTGTVINAKVVDANPKTVFDDATIKAVMRWKYNPKVEGGVAVERRGVEVLLRFNLEKQ